MGRLSDNIGDMADDAHPQGVQSRMLMRLSAVQMPELIRLPYVYQMLQSG